jgi:hypothetical protein
VGFIRSDPVNSARIVLASVHWRADIMCPTHPLKEPHRHE